MSRSISPGRLFPSIVSSGSGLEATPPGQAASSVPPQSGSAVVVRTPPKRLLPAVRYDSATWSKGIGASGDGVSHPSAASWFPSPHPASHLYVSCLVALSQVTIMCAPTLGVFVAHQSPALQVIAIESSAETVTAIVPAVPS